MNQKGKTILSNPLHSPRRIGSQQTHAFYVFNTEGNNGFVIVSGDDRTEAILGYADEGNYQEESIPENMKAWLQGYADYIEQLDNPSADSSQNTMGTNANCPFPSVPTEAVSMESGLPKTVSLHPAITPMLVTKWNQGNVNNPTYNQYCPSLNGMYAVTGCVATAVAQIMYYHQWPQEATNTIPSYDFTLTNDDEKYERTSDELPPFIFDWDAMLPIYTANNSQGDYEAVARLMQYCGYALKMGYGINGSGAFSENVENALRDYFDYDGNTHLINRSRYTAADWDEILYNELSEGRPVYYSGGSNGGAHAFVCDGYDGNGYYHINWGWGGSGDGFFKIATLNPSVSGIGGSTTKDGYAMGQQAVVGIQPNQGNPVFEEPLYLTTSVMTHNGTVISFDAFNTTGKDMRVLFGLGHYEDGQLTADFLYSYDCLLTGTGWGQLNVDMNNVGLPDGTYQIYPISADCDENWNYDEWLLNSSENLYLIVTIKNGVVTITEPYDLSVNDINLMGNGIAGLSQEIAVSISNQGTEFYGDLYFFASTDNNMGESLAHTTAVIEANSTEEISFFFNPSYASTYHIWIATNKEGTNVIGTIDLQFIDPPKGQTVLSLTEFQVEAHSTTTATVTVMNRSDVTYYRELWAFLNKKGEESTAAYQSTGALKLEPFTTQTFTYTFNDLEVGAEYEVVLYYYSRYDDIYVRSAGTTGWYVVEEYVVNEERAEVIDALDQLPSFAPHMSYDAEEFDRMRQLIANWRTTNNQLKQECLKLQEWLGTDGKGLTLTESERGDIAQELDNFNLELDGFEGIWTYVETEIANYISICNMYENMYQELLEWIEARRQELNTATTQEEIEAIRQQIYHKRLELIDTQLPTLAAPFMEELEPDLTNGRLLDISNRLQEIEDLLNREPTAINTIGQQLHQRADVWTLNGQLVRRQTTTLAGLPAGIYLIGGKKVTVGQPD